MMNNKTWHQVDNSNAALKIALRKKFLPEKTSVLDCFCGNGEMYHNVYKGVAVHYQGLDVKKVHTPELCTLVNNEHWVREHDLTDFNVFDLDAYGSPWKLFFLICCSLQRRATPYVFFLTDGSILRNKMNGAPPRFMSATEGISTSFVIPCINHWYVQMFMTMLTKCEDKYGVRIQRTLWLKNDNDSVYYWVIILKRE